MANSELTSRGLSLRDLLEKQDFPALTSNIKKPDNLVASSGSQKYSDKGSDDEQSNLSAFLGPNLWEKSCGTDFKLEYMDLDEFLVENGIPTDPISDSLENEPDQSSVTSLDLKSNLITASPTSSVVEDNIGFSDNDSLSSVQPSMDSPGEIKDESENHFFPGEKGFNPAKRRFTSDELKPQPLVKKSRKVFVPDEHKDEKYWARRKKNNVAAKRSRDARRVKENQIALRANFLENENQLLKAKLEKVLKDYSVIKKEKETLTSENLYLQKQLNKFNL